MWIAEFTRAMPVESSTKPASNREQTETATDPGAFQKPKPAIGNLESQVRARQGWIDAKGETTSREKKKLGERLLSAPAKTVQGRSTYTSCWKDRAKRSLYALVHTEHSATYGLPGTCIHRFLPLNNLGDVNLR